MTTPTAASRLQPNRSQASIARDVSITDYLPVVGPRIFGHEVVARVRPFGEFV